MGSFPIKQVGKKKRAISITVKSLATDQDDRVSISMREQVQHFLPAAFPLECTVKSFHIDKLNLSWKIVRTEGYMSRMENEQGRSGIVIFYDEFYKRLFEKSTCFQEHFPGLKMRSGILNRVIHFVCSIDVLKLKETERKLAMLGNSHVAFNVHPWMYGVFSETLVETVLLFLGEDASYEYYQSWTIALGFCLKTMLQQALKRKVNQRETYNEMFATQKSDNPAHSLASTVQSFSQFHSVLPTNELNSPVLFSRPLSES